MFKFGESQLISKGWAEGKGLGPSLDGMIDPITVKIKLDR